MKKIINNGQSAAKPLLNEERSETIETIINLTHDNNGVEYIKKIDGNGGNFENISYIYRHRRLDNNQIFYVGVGTDKTFKRAKDKYNRNIYWKRIVNKTDYSIEIILKNLNQKEAYELEEFIIDIYGLKKNGGILCNLTQGGKGGMKGLKQSQETINKKIISLTGKKRTRQQRQNISNSLKGLKKSEEHVQKLKNINLGKKLSQETCDKMSKSKYKKVLQIKNDETIKMWNSVKEASIFYNVNSSSISHCCAGRKKTIAGFKWEYFEN